jgi:succinoglycan biosynthesis protein ExoA
MTRRAICVIPTLNEEKNVGSLLAQLCRLELDCVSEILVTDGGSTDSTRDIVLAAGARDARVRLIGNPDRFQAAGINRAVAAALSQADTIVRMDAHADYSDDFVPRVLAAFEATGADMVTVRLRTVGETCLQRAIAAASNSRAGSGGSAHRIGGASGFVEHGHHAGMDRRMFERIGGYDESFAANEDAEFDYRVRREGGRIWLAADIEIIYHPRRTLPALFTQYRRYGRGRARTYLKHGERLRPRQLLPPALVLVLGSSLALSLVDRPFLLPAIIYVCALAVATIFLLVRTRDICTMGAGAAMATMHLAWGWGFLTTLLIARAARHGPNIGKGRPW